MANLIDTSPGWINAELKKLRREIEGLRTERRAAATTIGAGGLTIDGGDVVMLDTDGSVMFRLGEQPLGDRGFLLARASGAAAITVANAFGGATQQELRLRDRFGNEMLSEDAFGTGFTRPWITFQMQPVKAASAAVVAGPYGLENTHATTTWTTLFRAVMPRQNQFVTLSTRVAASDTTTSCELRLVDPASGAHLGQFLAGPFAATRDAGSTGYTAVSLPKIMLHGQYLEEIGLELQVRRTAGAGTLTVAVERASGSDA